MKKKDFKHSKYISVCPDCGSDDIDVKVWANATTVSNEEIITGYQDTLEPGYCNDCNTEHKHLNINTISIQKIKTKR